MNHSSNAKFELSIGKEGPSMQVMKINQSQKPIQLQNSQTGFDNLYKWKFRTNESVKPTISIDDIKKECLRI